MTRFYDLIDPVEILKETMNDAWFYRTITVENPYYLEEDFPYETQN